MHTRLNTLLGTLTWHLMACRRPKILADVTGVAAANSVAVVPSDGLSRLSVLHFAWHQKPAPLINTNRAGSRCLTRLIDQRQTMVCAASGFNSQS